MEEKNTKREKREYITTINTIMEELEVEELQAVHEMALICRANRQKEKNI